MAASKSTFVKRIASVSLLGLGFNLGLGAMSGCVSYTNVPVPNSAPAFKSANHTQSIKVLREALDAVITKHSVDGAYSINLPSGTTPESTDKIIAGLPAGVLMPSNEMGGDVPLYHIGRVWIRASDAKVDIVYPFIRADGKSEEQSVTVWLSGGVRSWRVYRMQYWTAGTIPTPPLYVPINETEQVAGQDDDLVAQPDADMVERAAGNAIQDATHDATQDAGGEPEAEPSFDNTSGYREVPTDD